MTDVMTNDKNSAPDVVRLLENSDHGIRSLMLSRTAIGYVIRGTKYIYFGDVSAHVGEGDMFIYDSGLHYEENCVGASGTFEQITFYLSPEVLQSVLLSLNSNYGLSYTDRHRCPRCRAQDFVSLSAPAPLRDFFAGVNASFLRGGLQHDAVAQRMKLNELVYLVLCTEDACVRSKLLSNADSVNGHFAMVIYDNVFKDISIETLAQMTNRSLTSFKKEFRRQFDAPPHKWFIAQRLNRSRLLLLSTGKTISEVGAECAFSNISHFIKLFKSRYRYTPAVFRQRFAGGEPVDGFEDNVAVTAKEEESVLA